MTLCPRREASQKFPEWCRVEIITVTEVKRTEDYSRPIDPFYIAPVNHTKTHGLNQKCFTAACGNQRNGAYESDEQKGGTA